MEDGMEWNGIRNGTHEGMEINGWTMEEWQLQSQQHEVIFNTLSGTTSSNIVFWWKWNLLIWNNGLT